MQDRVPLYPGRVTLTPVSGQANTYDMARADQPTQEGTPLNKSTLLTDAVASMFGFGASAVPNDMFNVLTHAGDLHVWRRTKSGVIDYPVSTKANAYTPGTSGDTTIEYLGKLGDKSRMQIVSYVGTGTYGASNPCSITADFPIKSARFLGFADGRAWSDLTDGSSRNVVPAELTTAYKNFFGFWAGANASRSYAKKSSDGKTITWYNTLSAGAQLNDSGTTYYFCLQG